MRSLFITLILLLPISLAAQDIDVKDSAIIVDGKPYAKIEKDGHGIFQEHIFTIYELTGKAAIVIKWFKSTSASEMNRANPKGEYWYADINFLQSKQKGQLRYLKDKYKDIAKLIVKSKLFKEGKIDQEAVDNFILINPVMFYPN